MRLVSQRGSLRQTRRRALACAGDCLCYVHDFGRSVAVVYLQRQLLRVKGLAYQRLVLRQIPPAL